MRGGKRDTLPLLPSFLPFPPPSSLVMACLRHTRCVGVLVVLCSYLIVAGHGSLLSNFSGPVDEWVVSPAEQKQWWGRWPGACGGTKCSDAVPSAINTGRRFPLTVRGDLLMYPPQGAAYADAGGDCSIGLQQAMTQRFASYSFTCGWGGYTPDLRNGPCPDMRLVMMPNMPATACFSASTAQPVVPPGPPRMCAIPSTGLRLSCTNDLLCPNDPNAGRFDDYTGQPYEPDEKEFCAAAIGYTASDQGPCYQNSLDASCGTAYLSFGKYEGVQAGNPPCDKEGPAEPGMGTGKNSGRCATPCVTYRAYDERYWVAERSFCPCLAARGLLPSVVREDEYAAQRADKYRYFLYHTEFALGFDAAGAL